MSRAPVRAARILEAIRQHKPSPTWARHCTCGFAIAEDDSQDAHLARAIASHLFGSYNADVRKIDSTFHHPGPDNIAMHRAAKEPLCVACQDWLNRMTQPYGNKRAGLRT